MDYKLIEMSRYKLPLSSSILITPTSRRDTSQCFFSNNAKCVTVGVSQDNVVGVRRILPTHSLAPMESSRSTSAA